MIILQEHSLTPQRKIVPESLSLKLTERGSTATMVPAEDDGDIKINTWIRDETDPGKNIVWRVSNIQTAFAAKTKTIQMEHAINTLRDVVLFGEQSANTAGEAVRMILGKQSDWALGEFEYGNVANEYQFDGETLFDALETVSNSLSDPVWTYDMTVYPFRLNIKKRKTDPTSEMRASRNLRTITWTMDKSSMYTRLYPIGHDDMHITGDYIEANTDIYGVVSKVETEASIESESELKRWAEERLKNHCEPVVTIEVDGLELANDTGESMDKFRIGEYCRVPLPEYNVTILETITALNYQDKVHQPEAVRVTMSNQRQDITISRILADAIKTASKSARTGTKQGKKDHAWFEDTDEHVSMCAIGIIGTDAQGNPNWVRLSEINVDGEGIHQSVVSLQGDMEVASARLDINEKEIKAEVKARSEQGEELRSTISQTATQIRSEVKSTKEGLESSISQTATQIRSEVKSTKEGLESSIKQNKDAIELTVKKGDVATQLAVEAGNVSVRNGDLIVDGMVTASAVKTAVANISDLTVGGVVRATHYYLGAGAIPVMIDSGVYDVTISKSGNNYTLKKQTYANGEWQDVYTFSRATSLSGSWSGSVWTVTASPQGNTKSIGFGNVTADEHMGVSTGSASIFRDDQGNENPRYITLPIYVQSLSDSGDTTRYTTTPAISVSNVYDKGKAAGWNSARGQVTIPGSGTGSYITCKWPGASVDTFDQRQYALNQDGATMKLQYVDGTGAGGAPNYVTAAQKAISYTLNKGSAWGKAKLYLQIVTPGGTGAWNSVKGYDDVYEITSGSNTYRFKASDGYWGWSEEPSVSF